MSEAIGKIARQGGATGRVLWDSLHLALHCDITSCCLASEIKAGHDGSADDCGDKSEHKSRRKLPWTLLPNSIVPLAPQWAILGAAQHD